MKVLIIGAGVGGLGTALMLSRDGHDVTLVERDATPLPADPAGAFAWNRRGAPQVRHSHAFLARLRNLLRDEYPDVLDALYDAGATDMDFIAMLPDGMDHTRLPGDEDLVALACRRTTFEWVLRRIVIDEHNVTLLDGHGVKALTGSPTTAETPAMVSGVVLDDGTEIVADLVVASPGRRSSIPELLAPLGVTIEEHVEDTGIIYYSRFFELRDGADWPVQMGPIGGDLGYLKFGVFRGDNRTFSVTLSTRSHDDELRSMFLDPDVFLRAAEALPATAAYVDGRARPITDVYVMAKLLNRHRRFTNAEGTPLVVGFSAVGDAHTCTNPLYGRGCSLAMVQADLLARSLREHPADSLARAGAYEAATAAEIHPWYRASVSQDQANRAEVERLKAIESGDTDVSTDENLTIALLRDGLFPAMRVDPVVLRAFLRMFNLLEAPDSLMTNFDVIGRVMTVFQDRDQRPPEEPLGPNRAALLELLAI